MRTPSSTLVFAFVLTVATGVSSFSLAQEENQPTASQEKCNLDIKLRVVSNTKWRLTLKADRQVTAIRFLENYPHLDWKVESRGFELKTIDQALVIKRVDNQPFDEAVCEVAPEFRETVKDYEPLWEFSDGAIMIYTGQFPWEVSVAAGEFEEVNRSFMFATDRAECIVLDGVVKKTKLANNEVKWSPGNRDSYVYFGNGSIEETDSYIGLIDPELPEWIQDRMKVFMPRIVDYYSERIGVSLPNRPMLMFSFDSSERHKGHTNFTGGTLPGLVQLNVTGSGWQHHDKKNAQHLCKFLAHESAHLWNSKLIRPARGSRPWIHEGSAEMMAFNALLHLGVIDRHEYQQILQDAVDRFVENSLGISLNQSLEHGKPKNLYDGGIVIGLMVQQAARNADPNADFLDFWKYFTTKVLESGERYSHQDFVDAVREFTKHEQLSNWTLEFPATKLENPAVTIGDMFKELDFGKRANGRVLLDSIE